MKDWTRLLLSVLPPPEEVSPRWRIPAGDDTTAYPGDYLELMGLYGPGCVDDFLCLLAPQHPNENLDAHRLGPAWMKGIEELAGTVGERLPPEAEDFGDLVAWAGTDNGDMCFWIPGRRNPSAHLVAIRAGRDDEWSVHPMGIAEFLVKWLRHRLVVPVFPDDVPADEHSFTPLVAGSPDPPPAPPSTHYLADLILATENGGTIPRTDCDAIH